MDMVGRRVRRRVFSLAPLPPTRDKVGVDAVVCQCLCRLAASGATRRLSSARPRERLNRSSARLRGRLHSIARVFALASDSPSLGRRSPSRATTIRIAPMSEPSREGDFQAWATAGGHGWTLLEYLPGYCHICKLHVPYLI